MLIHFVKFFHLLVTLALLGSTFACLILTGTKKNMRTPAQGLILKFNWIILSCLVFAGVTGTFLVYPKHFTFHTPWIQAAYLFVSICSVIMGLLIFFNKTNTRVRIWQLAYLFMMVILVGVVHDAVTKSTFVF